MTQNVGLSKKEQPELDPSVHIGLQSQVDDDGYTNMDAYNRVLPDTVNYRQPGGNR